MTEWTTAAVILARSGASSSPSPDDLEYAELCAAAVNAGIDDVLEDVLVSRSESPAERMLDETPPETETATDLGPMTLGAGFSVTAPGRITHIRWWHKAGCGGFDHVPAIWQDRAFGSGLLVASVPGVVDPSLEGYVELELPAPLVVAPIAGLKYRVAYTVLPLAPYALTMVSPPPSVGPHLGIEGAFFGVGVGVYPNSGSGGEQYHADIVYREGLAPDPVRSGTVTGTEPELLWLASMAGVEAFKRREAVFGITGYVDLQGAAIRVARDYLEAQRPILNRYASPGIA